MAIDAIYTSWETDQQVVYYHGSFGIRTGAIDSATAGGTDPEGAAVTPSYTAPGDFLLTINDPTGAGVALDILAVLVTEQTAAVGDSERKAYVGAIDQTNRTIQINVSNADAAAPALVDPADGDRIFYTIITKQSLASQ